MPVVLRSATEADAKHVESLLAELGYPSKEADVRYSAAFGGNPDSEPTLPQGPSLTRIVLRCVPSVTIEPIVKCYTWQNFL